MIDRIQVDGIQIDLVFKKIKKLHLRILSFDGAAAVMPGVQSA